MSTEAQKRASRKYYLKNKERYNEWIKATQKRHRRERKEYKEIIDKAIEYIKYNNDDLYTYNPDYDYEENIVDNYEPSNFREDLLNILQGSENK